MSEAVRPLLPYRIAKDSIDELKGFVSTMLFARDIDTREAILECLFEKAPIVKGPFVDLKLPFRASEDKWPLDSRLESKEFKPYLHQMKAYQQLKSENALNTLITTGTGSGKSECFIMPILDYVIKCKAQGKNAGIKALIIYPMNALIEDQGERLSQLANQLNASLPEREKIRIGRYNRNSGSVKEHDPKNPKLIIDNRESLCANPPDILLTNFRMLDFMLLRPEEQNFWLDATQDVFKYLVLDELHTFDGAQGADVASLVRRLRLKIDTEFVCVGTSATVGDGSEKSIKDLCEFATTLFGSQFDPKNVIGEDRYRPEEILKPIDSKLKIPNEPIDAIDLIVKGADGYQEYIEALCANWSAPINQQKLGEWLICHPLIHQILESVRAGTEFGDLASKCEVSADLLGEFLDLISYARKGAKAAVFPLTTQVWVQSVPYLMRRLHKEPHFLRPNTEEFTNIGADVYLPAVNCRECGLSGWLTTVSADPVSDQLLFEENADKVRSVFYRDEDAAFIFPKNTNVTDEYKVYYAVPGHNRLYAHAPEDLESFQVVVAVQTEKLPNRLAQKGLGHSCPSCASRGSMGVSFFGDSMMGSVMANAFLASGANPTDKKYLIFNDSVQDTSHQAGYLSARGYRFNFRRYLLSHVKRSETADSMGAIISRVNADIKLLWENAGKKTPEGRKSLYTLLQIIPKDLWERWATKSRSMPIDDPKNLGELCERVDWECWLEFSFISELGWSLRKTTLVALEPKAELFERWKSVAANLCQMKSEWKDLKQIDSFIYGMIRRFVTQGALYREDLEDCYTRNKFSYWPIQSAKPHLANLFFPRSPRIISSGTNPFKASKSRPPVLFMASGSTTSWFTGWAKKHGLTRTSSADFYSQFLERIANEKAGFIRICPEINPDLMVLDTDQFEVHWKKTKLMRCDSCNHMSAVAVGTIHLSCTQMHCPGEMHDVSVTAKGNEESSFLNYMARQYERPIISPLAHSHNSQLEGDDRQKVEQAFKRNLLPGDSLNETGKGKPYYNDHPINVLTCTPTMEMGIDIGTLSGVALRSFPRTLANARQRLGRSGRSSGNAFNTVISQHKPHDNHFWQNPSEFFAGPIKAPGCEFRNKQILLRQFNAYCLDEYAKANKDLRIPKSDEMSGENLAENIFYKKLFEFLKKDTKTLVKPFLDAVELGMTDKDGYSTSEMLDFLTDEIKKESFVKAIQFEINEITKKRAGARKEESEADALLKTAEKSAATFTDFKQVDSRTDELENINKKRSYADFIKRQFSDSDYILKRLADRGHLPNYAFPEEGVRLDYSVRLPIDSKAINYKDKFKFKQGHVNRNPVQALLEFAPGGSYYTDGFKVPITRLSSDYTEPKITPYLCCTACGAMTDATGIKATHADCPHCREDGQPIMQLLDFRTASSTAEFGNAQITDQEEQRERQRVRLETFINHNLKPGSESQSATWLSPSAHIAIEFRTSAEIFHINRNLKYKEDEPHYYEVCKECLAVPFRYEDKTPIFKQWGVNRHAIKCQFRNAEGSTELAKVALGRKLNSDVISILADGNAYAPTMHALLSFAMQTYLKGSPAHLVVGTSKLKIKDHGYRNIMTLYDNVPGGTGHLRSLMQFSQKDLDKSISGLKALGRIFKNTLEALEACSCVSGCYKCLLSYENQYYHSQINKEYAVNWLKRFIEVKDWEPRNHALSIAVGHDTAFDSVAEEYFVDGLRKIPQTIPGADRCKEIFEANTHAFEIYSRNLKAPSIIQHTAFTNIPLNGRIPYTRPDFTIYRGGKEAGFIYVDGRDPHLSPGEDISVFELKDISIRNALREQYQVPVLVFSHDMVNWWRDAGSFPKTVQFGPQKTSVLAKVIVQLANPESEYKGDLKKLEEDIKGLSASFIAHELAFALGVTVEGYLDDVNTKMIKAFISQWIKPFKIGGLAFDPQSKVFAMDSSPTKRLDPSGQIDPVFKLSWELFWMLWMVDPSLVKLQKTSNTDVKSGVA